MTRRVLLLALLAVGCGVRPVDPPDPKAPDAADAFPRTVTDSFDYSLTIPARPTRIISAAPSNTEILFAVGAGPQVVGVTTFCNYPPEAARLDKIGGFSPRTISSERVVGLRPDLVLTTGRIQQPLSDSLRKIGLPVLSYDAQTLEEVIRNVRHIGDAVGRADEAGAVATNLERRLARIKERTAALPEERRPRVLLLLSEDPLMTAGPKTYAGQLLEAAGGRNVFADVEQQFPRVSEEDILKRDPAVVLLWQRGDGQPSRERLAKRPGWERLDAFRAGRVLAIEDDLISRAGPRLFDGLEKMAGLLHPRKE